MKKISAALIAAFLSAAFPADAFPQTAAQQNLIIGKGFDGLVRHDGTVFNHRQLAGKPTLLFFGFVSCGSICPTALQTITLAAEDLAKKYGADKVPNLVFVTTRPTHEGADQLAGFLKNFHPGFIGLGAQKGIESLMGDPVALSKVQQIEMLIERFRVVRGDHHSPFAYLMDADLRFIGKPLNTQANPEQLAAEMSKILNLKTDLAVQLSR